MLKVSLRNLLINKLRLFLTVAAVTVGVTFVSGTYVLSDTMVKAFGELYSGLTSGTDVVVRSEAAYGADAATTGGQVRPIDETVVATVGEVPGVAVAEGSVFGFALVLDEDGEPIQPGGAPTLGTSLTEDLRLAGAATFREGDPPSGPEEMALDARTVEQAGYELGDQVDVVFRDGRRTFTLVGVIGFGETDSLLGATMAGFDLPTAQDVLGKAGVVDEVDVLAEDGIGARELRDRIAEVVPDGVETLTGEQVAADGTESVKESMGVFTTVLLVFAGVSVLVGSFVIWNTFNVLVAQRRREVALLRAVGATRRQVLTGVLIEAGVIGLVSGMLGLLLGVGLAIGIRSLLETIGIEMPTTSPAVETRTIVVAMSVGLLVTMGAAVAPAWAATRVAPMEALRNAVPASGGVSRGRRTAGWVLTGVGFAALAACAVVGDQRWATVFATVTAFAGLVVAGPTLARGMARLADHGPRGGGWRMASRNIARSSRRSAAAALALTIGLTVVVAVAVTATSLKESVSDAVTGGNRSDLILEPAGAGLGISPSVADLLRARDDVADVVELRETAAQVNGDASLVTAMDIVGLDRVIDLGMEDGSLDELAPGGVLVSTSAAEDLGVGVGDELTVTFAETGETTMTVVGTFSKGLLINASYLMTLPDFNANVTTPLDGAILLNTTPGVDPEQAKGAIEAALADYPNVTVNDPEEITANARDSVDQLLGIVTAMLLLAVIVAVLGIVNTLVLSVVERTRELGLLRAV
ncbi:ABC transporter permease, partial [Nocardioides sp.]|uniref:ABC transporter permease n=1 Tax=Nocardioides sp. TaxID=35761 RepID=UPI002734FEA6